MSGRNLCFPEVGLTDGAAFTIIWEVRLLPLVPWAPNPAQLVIHVDP